MPFSRALPTTIESALARVLTGHRVVLASNFTQVLDLVDEMCQQMNWPTTRLDGSTPPCKRQQLVEAFNASGSGPQQFVFLIRSAYLVN